MQEDTPGKGGDRRSGSVYNRGGARSRRIHQVREEAGDQTQYTAEEEPGGGAGGYTRYGRRQEIRLSIQQRRSQEQVQEDTPGKGGGRRSDSGYSRGGARSRSRRIHQVREETGD